MVSAPDVPEASRALIAQMDKVEQAYGPVALAIVGPAVRGKREEAFDGTVLVELIWLIGRRKKSHPLGRC